MSQAEIWVGKGEEKKKRSKISLELSCHHHQSSLVGHTPHSLRCLTDFAAHLDFEPPLAPQRGSRQETRCLGCSLARPEQTAKLGAMLAEMGVKF